MKIKLSGYYKVNKKHILRNWKHKHIREAHNFSILNYITAMVDHIKNDLAIYLNFDIPVSEIKNDLYKTL